MLLGFLCGHSVMAQRPSSLNKPGGADPVSTQTGEPGKKENLFAESGFSGIGTLAPTAPFEIRKNAGNTRNKNVLLKLSNEWSKAGQNEPSIMFSNGDNTKNHSFWTLGARVSGDEASKAPQTFKVSFKGVNDPAEKEYFSIDSYEGRVRIGDVNTQVDGYKLYVEQGILTEKVKVAIKNGKDWFDHVFHKDYPLMPLADLQKYISIHGHLPDVPTTQEVMKDGLDLGQMNALLLKKVEELTLYTLQLKKELDETKALIKRKK